MRRFVAIVICALALVSVNEAQAETFSLSIVDPVSCAARHDLLQQVMARAKDAAPVDAGGQFSFSLRLEQRSDSIVAELQTTHLGHITSTRVLDGKSCQEVLVATALIMALTVDSRTSSDANAGATGADATFAQSTLPNSSPAPAQTSVGNAPKPPPYSVEGDFNEPRAPAKRSAPPSSSWRVGVGLAMKWTNLFANHGGMWLGGLRGEATRTQRTFMALEATLGPRVVGAADSQLNAESSFYGAGVEIGTLLVSSRNLAADALLMAAVGQLHVTATRRDMVASSRDANATWLGVGPAVRLRWFGESASLALQAAVPFNIIRPTFAFVQNNDSTAVLYKTPPVGVFFGLCGTWNVEPSSQHHRVIKSKAGGD